MNIELKRCYQPPISHQQPHPPLKSQNMAKICVYCEKELIGRKLKYCDNGCRYRFNSINNEKKKFSVSQHLRMARAARSQRMEGSAADTCRINPVWIATPSTSIEAICPNRVAWGELHKKPGPEIEWHLY